MRVTIDEMDNLRLGVGFPRERFYSLWAGRESLTLIEISNLDMPVKDKIRVLLNLLPLQKVVLFASECAGRMLAIYEMVNPGDDRPRKAVESARLWALGENDEEDLYLSSIIAQRAQMDAYTVYNDELYQPQKSFKMAATVVAGAAHLVLRSAFYAKTALIIMTDYAAGRCSDTQSIEFRDYAFSSADYATYASCLTNVSDVDWLMTRLRETCAEIDANPDQRG